VNRALAVSTLVTLFVVAIQLAVLSTLRVGDVVVMLVWLWPLLLGLMGARLVALWSALLGGVMLDTHAVTPFGLTALVALVLAYLGIRLGREGVGDLDSAAWWVTPVIAALGGFVAPLLYVMLGAIEFNFALWRGSVLMAMVVNAVAFFVLSRPLAYLARYLVSPGERTRR
jgi:hypothetical protein